MFDSDKAKSFAEKYGDDAYRFAFVITLSPDAAEKAVCAAFSALTSDTGFDTENPDKRRIFASVYSHAKKYASSEVKRGDIEALYGEKPEEFYEVLALPPKERAAEHLMLYEGYTEDEAQTILKCRIDD